LVPAKSKQPNLDVISVDVAVEVTVVVTVVTGVVDGVVTGVDVAVDVSVVEGVATWQSWNSPVWYSAIASLSNAAPLQSSPLKSLIKPEPLHPKIAGFASPRVNAFTMY
jgi:hypothetical protein